MGESAALGETPKVLRGKGWCRGDGGVRGGVRGIVAALVAAHSRSTLPHPGRTARRAPRPHPHRLLYSTLGISA